MIERRDRRLRKNELAESFRFTGWNLQEGPGPGETGGMGYNGHHYSHSREFRPNIAAEWKF
jgi:hypothetical protein